MPKHDSRKDLLPELLELKGKPLTHDKFFEKMFEMEDLARSFLKFVLPKDFLPHLKFEDLSVEPKDFLNLAFKETRADMIYRVPLIGRDEDLCIYVLLEHKSFDDFMVAFQTDIYADQISHRQLQKAKEEKRFDKNFRLSPVLVIIIHHGETSFSGPTNVSEVYEDLEFMKSFLPYRKAILHDLTALPEDQIPDDPEAPELYVVQRIMQVIFRSDIGMKGREILERLRPYSNLPKYRRIIRFLWFYLVSSARFMSKSQLMIVNEAVEETIGENVMPTIWETVHAEGLAVGLAEGKAEGLAEGKAESILAVLCVRFKDVSLETCKQVRAIKDLTALDSHLTFAATCATLEDFVKSLK